MKFYSSLALTALLAFAVGLFNLPWYSFVFTSLIIAFGIHQPAKKTFIAGFLGVFILWLIYCFFIDAANNHILSGKVANILPLAGSSFLLILVGSFIGGLLSANAAMIGHYLRKAIK